jgi:hypothetical protein
LASGHAQGHVEGDTWAITQIHQFPNHKTVNILVVVGNMEDSLKLEAKIEKWAKGIGVDRMTAIGRDGWERRLAPGWKKYGVMYSKDI